MTLTLTPEPAMFFLLPDNVTIDFGPLPAGSTALTQPAEVAIWRRRYTPAALAERLRLHRLWSETNGREGVRANLRGAYLAGANLAGANLAVANLAVANLAGANLTGANLAGATMPDGRPWEVYREDHLAGICTSPDVIAKAVAAWGSHDWTSCPMHSALGIDDFSDVSDERTRLLVACWVALYDARWLTVEGAVKRVGGGAS